MEPGITQRVDILLVNPPLSTVVLKLRSGLLMAPLGLGYLAAVLEQAGYKVGLVDMQAEEIRGSGLVRVVQERQPQVVGIGTMVNTYKNGLRVARLVKNFSPTTKVIVGGPQATFLVKETLACPAVDVLVRYEGEETIVELMRHFDGDGRRLDSICGIAFRDGDRIHQTEPRPLIADLDSLPMPARHLFKMDRYGLAIVITARGCPSHCVFCAANALYPSQSYRERSPHLVVDEIEEMVERYSLDSFFIADDTFTLRAEHVMEICDLLIERKIRAKWLCEARVDTMTPKIARKLVDAGCIEVQYGVETGHQEIMKLIRKGIKLKEVEDVVNYSQAMGLNVVCSFIIGFPWDTHETVQRTLDFGHRLSNIGAPLSDGWRSGRGRVMAGFAPLTPLPGTYVYEHAEELGIRFLTRDWDRYTFSEPVIETLYLTATDIRNFHMSGFR
jgi:anaerobic magnesium-protoporphyrin IX monomethyl ester cyclase